MVKMLVLGLPDVHKKKLDRSDTKLKVEEDSPIIINLSIYDEKTIWPCLLHGNQHLSAGVSHTGNLTFITNFHDIWY